MYFKRDTFWLFALINIGIIIWALYRAHIARFGSIMIKEAVAPSLEKVKSMVNADKSMNEINQVMNQSMNQMNQMNQMNNPTIDYPMMDQMMDQMMNPMTNPMDQAMTTNRPINQINRPINQIINQANPIQVIPQNLPLVD